MAEGSLRNAARLLLLYPPCAGAHRGAKGVHYPLGIGYIAAALRDKYNVVVHDFHFDVAMGVYSLDAVKSVVTASSYDFIMIGGVSPDYYRLKEIVYACRKFTKAPIIMGGAHVKPAVQATDDWCGADYYVIGEGESIIVELMSALMNNTSLSSVKGIVYHENGSLIHTECAAPIVNLDSIKFPARDLTNFNNYKRYFALGHPLTYNAHLISSRGCPLSCTFCNPTFGRSVRVRSPENILEEIRMLRSCYDVRFIHFHDEVLLGGRKTHVRNFCEHVLRQGTPNFSWGGNTNAELLDKETLTLMRRAGCSWIAFGLESGSVSVLKSMHKRNRLDKFSELFAHCKTIGIDSHFSLLTNEYSETFDTLRETEQYLLSLNKNCFFRGPIYFNYLIPVPGTQIYDETKARGLWTGNDIDNILAMSQDNSGNLVVNLTQMEDLAFVRTVEEIEVNVNTDYDRKHIFYRFVYVISNLTHFNFLETLRLSDIKSIRAILEGLLWALCRGDDTCIIGRLYKLIVYGTFRVTYDINPMSEGRG